MSARTYQGGEVLGHRGTGDACGQHQARRGRGVLDNGGGGVA